MWSSTIPVACINAYAVVGPTKRKPRRRSSLAIAVDSGVVAARSANVRGRGRAAGSGANDHSSGDSPAGSSRVARAFAIAASIFARLRTMPVSASNRVTSASSKLATFSGSNPANAARNPSRLRRIVSHDSPDWNASRHIFSNSRTSSCCGTPHSRSW